MKHTAARLQWVLVDDALVHVSKYKPLPPNQRPACQCPVCNQPVTMKLGNIREHHCAHRTGAVCVATRPETALHLNVKYYLAKQLEAASSLVIFEPCQGTGCTSYRRRSWLSGWNRVEVEHTIESYRPDIVLFKDTVPIGAIEVYVTHAVEEAKEQYLQKLNIPWIEVEGNEAIYQGDGRWTPRKPLPFCLRSSQPWQCGICYYFSDEGRHFETDSTRIFRYRIVDLFYPSGGYFREVYWLVEKHIDGVRKEVWLASRSDRTILARVASPFTLAERKRIKDAFDSELNAKRTKAHAYVDSPMDWAPWPPAPDPEAYVFDEIQFPCRYVWWNKEQKWFLPKAMRHVRWTTGNENE